MVVLLRPPGRRGNHNHKSWGLSSGDCTRVFSEAPDSEMRMAEGFWEWVSRGAGVWQVSFL